MKKCVFSGMFDPPTTGHKRIIEKCSEIFDEVVVAVMINPEKVPLLSVENRVKLLKKLFDGGSVRVRSFDGAAVDLLKEENTKFYVRGVRNTVDFEYENANYFASKQLMDGLTVIYIPAEQGEIHVSSTLVKNSLKFKKDYKKYVPEEIWDDLQKMIAEKP